MITGNTLASVFQNHSTYSTVEALCVPVLSQSLNPAIGRFDGEFAAVAFGGEKFVPMRRTILITVLDVEARRSDRLLSKGSRDDFRLNNGLRTTKTDGMEDDEGHFEPHNSLEETTEAKA